jgi:hypothetical protein
MLRYFHERLVQVAYRRASEQPHRPYEIRSKNRHGTAHPWPTRRAQRPGIGAADQHGPGAETPLSNGPAPRRISRARMPLTGVSIVTTSTA